MQLASCTRLGVGLFIILLLMPSIPIRASSGTVSFVGVAKYYDNRRCAVTVSLDDLPPRGNYSQLWQSALSMLVSKHIYVTVGVITDPYPWLSSADWSFIQYYVNTGYVEPASHSRDHVSVPYIGNASDGTPKISYEWQINGSRNDILGNLTLPSWSRSGSRQYVYSWIEPDGAADAETFRWLGITHYVLSRGAGDFLDPQDRIHIAPTPPWGLGPASADNNEFDLQCSLGSIYEIADHPANGLTPWTRGSQADIHTSYISNRTDVWYAPLGILYLYRWLSAMNVVIVAPNGEQNGTDTYQLSIASSDHQNYGASYPRTYVFKIPEWWAQADAYYRISAVSPWQRIMEKSSQDDFNGVQAARFNFTEHYAYVSVGFASESDDIYLQLKSNTTPPVFLPGSVVIGGVVAIALSVAAVFTVRRRFTKRRNPAPITPRFSLSQSPL